MPLACLLHAGEDGNSSGIFRDVSGYSFSGTDQCSALLVMLEQITVSVPEGTIAAPSMLCDFWSDSGCKCWLHKLQA